MKKSFMAIALSCSILLVGCGKQTEESKPKRNPDVREACWGDDIKTVKSNETADPLSPYTNPASYRTRMYDCDAVIFYEFDNEYGLYEVTYSLTGIGAESSYENYVRMVKDLTYKYGESERSDIGLSFKEEYKNNPVKGLSDGIAIIADSWKRESQNAKVFTMIKKNADEPVCYDITCSISRLDFNPEESTT